MIYPISIYHISRPPLASTLYVRLCIDRLLYSRARHKSPGRGKKSLLSLSLSLSKSASKRKLRKAKFSANTMGQWMYAYPGVFSRVTEERNNGWLAL